MSFVMWDVSGIEPHEEIVGQRRSRKPANCIASSKPPVNISRRSSVLSLNSSERQQKKPTLPDFFGVSNFSSNQTKPSSQRVNSASELMLAAHDEKDVKAAKWANPLYEVPSEDYQVASEPIQFSLSTKINTRCDSEKDQSIISDCRSTVGESIFSGWTGSSDMTKTTWSTMVSPGSSHRSAKVLKSNTTSSKKAERSACSREMSGTFEVMSSLLGIEPLESSRTRRKNSAAIAAEKSHSATGWKAPDAWGCRLNDNLKRSKKEVSLKPGKGLEKLQFKDLKIHSIFDISYIRRYIKVKEAASPEIVSDRLTENWRMSSDASIYREIELEKQLLMLIVLRRIEKSSRKRFFERSFSGNERILSLYENYASSSSIAALTTAKEMHHLAVDPLSPDEFPNVKPCAVIIPTTQLPYPANYFMSITALSVSTLFPASAIPDILRECRRVLVSPYMPVSPTLPAIFNSYSRSKPARPRSGGCLHLTMVDPAPVQATTGPHLREWLDKNLIINLERNFRCTSPSRLIPVWLADAGLNGEGSTNKRVRFYASVTNSTSVLGKAQDPQEKRSENKDFSHLKMESIVGRMFWKDVWGNYVHGEKWWWEDEKITEECEQLGTCWEYSIIEAFKAL